MAKKERVNYSLDGKVVDEFRRICKRNDAEYSTTIENLMKHYIAKDGEVQMDDLYAPRISAMVGREIDNHISRLAGMLHNVQVDTTATLYALPALYKKNQASTEQLLNDWMDERLLNPNRVSYAQHFEFNTDGMKIIENTRNYARKDLKARKRVKEDE